MKHFTIVPCTAVTFIFLSSILQHSYLAEAESVSGVLLTNTEGNRSSEYCPYDVNFCPQAAKCCQLGVDEYGWIAAAVGWSLWFLTLILLCVDKLMKLRPDEPKYLQA
ncbi:transmembrane protein 213 [Emydura macquarii macquarii]|uniref:transmembrane protein 213 n=1 Tax=Emydura macquarii macquarii TaxID=1129001 RepID=UPI00352B0513